jgi:hypothetical protein
MGRSYHSVVRRIENAREEKRTTSISPSKPICKEIFKLLKRYSILDEYCDEEISIKLYYNSIPSCINDINHNRLSAERINEKIIKHLKEVEVTYQRKGKKYSVNVKADDPVAREIAKKLSRKYDLNTGKCLSQE